MSKLLDRIADASGLVFLLLRGRGLRSLRGAVLPADPGVPRPRSCSSSTPTPSTGASASACDGVRRPNGPARLRGPPRRSDPGVRPTRRLGRGRGVSIAALSAAVKVASFGPGLVGRQHHERYDPETVTAMFDLNEAAYDLSWALDGVFLLLLGHGRARPRRHAPLAGRLGADRRRSHRGRHRSTCLVREPPTGLPALAGRREHLGPAHTHPHRHNVATTRSTAENLARTAAARRAGHSERLGPPVLAPESSTHSANP